MTRNQAARLTMLAAIVITLALPLAAEQRSWTGAAATWNTSSAWSPAGVPVTGDNLVFPFTLQNRTSTMNLAGTPVFTEIRFDFGGYVINADGADHSMGVSSRIVDASGGGGTSIGVPIVLSNIVDLDAAIGPLVLGGNLTGTGGVLISGAGVVRFSAFSNQYDGATTVRRGTLELALTSTFGGPVAVPETLIIGDGVGGVNADVVRLRRSDMIGDDSDVTVNNTGLLDLNDEEETIATLAGNGNVDLGSGRLAVKAGSTTFSGVISGTGDFTKRGTGELTFSGASSNTYTGTTMVSESILILSHTAGSVAVPGNLVIGDGDTFGIPGIVRIETQSNNIADSSEVTILFPGVLNLFGFNETVRSLLGTGSVALGMGRLRFDASDSGSRTFSGTIRGIGGITMQGSGTQVFTGFSDFSGPTNVSSGTLVIDGSHSESEVLLTGGRLAGSGRTGQVRALSGSSIRPGGVTVGTLSTGNLVLGGAPVNVGIDLLAGTSHDQIDVTGSVDLGTSTSLVIITISSAVLPGSIMPIIRNDSVDPVVGQFSGLPEGSIIRPSLMNFRVSYAGGTGNDVTLTAMAIGDVDGNNRVEVLDIFALLSFLFGDGPTPAGDPDVNRDLTTDVLDVFELVNFLF